MKRQANEEKAVEQLMATDERKRSYNAARGGTEVNKMVSEAEMEAYYRKRQRTDDPMAQFMGK